MEPEDLAFFRNLLLELKDKALNAGDIEIEPNQKETWEKPDSDDDQPLNEMHQIIASERNKARTGSLQLILAALERMRIAPDDFGFCIECDELIPRKRLELMPYVTMCVKCQSAYENSPKRGHRRSLTDFG